MGKQAVYGIETFQEAKDKIGLPGILACLLCAPFLMTNCFVGTGLAQMYVEFGDIPSEIVALVITIPSLCSVVFSVVGGQLAQKYPIRKVFIGAAVINIVGGILPIFLNNIYAILASRAIYGIGFGLAFSLGSSLISIVFGGEMKKKMLGLGSAIGMAVCFLFIWISAALLKWGGWKGTFYGYLVLIPFLLLDVFFMPKNVTPKELGIAEEKTAEDKKEKLSLSPLFLLFMVVIGVYNIAGMASGTNLGIYMMTDGLSTVDGYALASNLSMIAQMVFALAYPYVQKVLKYYTVPVAMVIAGIGYVLLAMAQDTASFCFANFVTFAGAGVFNPASVYVNNRLSRPEQASRMMGIYYSVTGVGQFITAFALSWLAGIFGVTSHRAPFVVSVGICMVLGIAYAVVITIVAQKEKMKGNKLVY